MEDNKLLRLNVKIHNTFLLAHYAGRLGRNIVIYTVYVCSL